MNCWSSHQDCYIERRSYKIIKKINGFIFFGGSFFDGAKKQRLRCMDLARDPTLRAFGGPEVAPSG